MREQVFSQVKRHFGGQPFAGVMQSHEDEITLRRIVSSGIKGNLYPLYGETVDGVADCKPCGQQRMSRNQVLHVILQSRRVVKLREVDLPCAGRRKAYGEYKCQPIFFHRVTPGESGKISTLNPF